MITDGDFEIFLATSPGLETVLCAEARAKGFKAPKDVPGGVTFNGGWPDVWRANLEVRGIAVCGGHTRIDNTFVELFPRLEIVCSLSFRRRRPADRDGDPRGTRCATVGRCRGLCSGAH